MKQLCDGWGNNRKNFSHFILEWELFWRGGLASGNPIPLTCCIVTQNRAGQRRLENADRLALHVHFIFE